MYLDVRQRLSDTPGISYRLHIQLRMLPLTDEFYVDIKHMNSQVHREYTTADNKLILENIRNRAENDAKIIVRVPLIPGVNDDNDNLLKTYEFVNSCGYP